ncbi:MFS-type efflux pump MFS2 [Fulvia fulva]|uniref:MFS-type efflux pump MFS2 n=1 Tax=Passalora fulva TaxID=5499 RepID=A0A9Q8LJ52_PASFU|nr:MFS-type efflux pump MFS2 [Fulvia fulva]KAK4624050.1 MFS-type efflux pump MFS2 [Fulvia fulva]KAK4625403.1 MFS-type efflux pump MFS2 [Fulvia fulva]UJO18356.1 MFS-type efflux pump MFS2 [Fulvia fulva]WPV15469.1 MFS-type efflux pump MFS2 [Fulvia fulva]WPV29606.1 MFS-type efflux pump MFS2 [Fulvia fulva]
MIWFGWTSFEDVHWIAGTIALGAFGVGVYYIYLSATNYLADAYEKYAASALSAVGFGRNAFGAFLPLATPALYKNVGFQWASTMLGIIGLVLSLVPFVLLIKGPYLRSRSPFMLDACLDDDEATGRRDSIAEMQQGRQERKGSAILPWSQVRSASVA